MSNQLSGVLQILIKILCDASSDNEGVVTFGSQDFITALRLSFQDGHLSGDEFLTLCGIVEKTFVDHLGWK